MDEDLVLETARKLTQNAAELAWESFVDTPEDRKKVKECCAIFERHNIGAIEAIEIMRELASISK